MLLQGMSDGKNGDTVPGFNNILTLCPPFVLTEDEFEFIADTLIAAFSAF
jgi:taurine-pyruvate aminotransferase